MILSKTVERLLDAAGGVSHNIRPELLSSAQNCFSRSGRMQDASDAIQVSESSVTSVHGSAVVPDEHGRRQSAFPQFIPATGLSNAHVQTIVGTMFGGRPKIEGTRLQRVRLADGDSIVLHDDQPRSWRRGGHVALLMHGLCGDHSSGYMMRICKKLMDCGVRVFRMDHRGSGAAENLSRRPYNAGRIHDLESAIAWIERDCPGSPVSIAGFSLSGNLLLRYLGDDPDRIPLSIFRAVAVCPPIDLEASVDFLAATSLGQRYDWYFARRLVDHVVNTPLWRDDLPLANVHSVPRRIIEFDELFTAPASGYQSAHEYYEDASAINCLDQIRVHTTVLAAEDDPMIPTGSWDNVTLPPNISLCRTAHGGHLGYVGRSGADPDRRWMDWRVVDWLLH